MKLCAFADEASVDLQGQIEALKRNKISLLEIRGVDGQNIKEISYDKIKEIANLRNVSPREVTTSFKARLTKDYGVVIDQIKKELMIKYRVNHGEGKAPNALEAIDTSTGHTVEPSVT